MLEREEPVADRKKHASPRTKKKSGRSPAPSVVKTWPKNDPYERALALMLRSPPTAFKLFAAAAALQPERARIHINWSLGLSAVGHHDDARVAAERAFELDPQDAHIAARRLYVQLMAGDMTLAKAVHRVMQIPAVAPDDRRATQVVKCWMLANVAPADGLRETERLLAAWPGDAEVMATHGSALAAMCRWDDAVAWLDQAIATAPEDSQLSSARSVSKGTPSTTRTRCSSQYRLFSRRTPILFMCTLIERWLRAETRRAAVPSVVVRRYGSGTVLPAKPAFASQAGLVSPLKDINAGAAQTIAL